MGCANKQIDFTAAVDGGAPTAIGSATTDSTGNFMFSHTFGDGTQTAISAKSAVTGSSPNGFVAITDVTAPTLTIAAPQPDGFRKLFVTAKTGNLNVKAGTAGYIADLDDTTPGGQVGFSIIAGGAGPSAGTGTGKVSIHQGTAPKLETPVSTNVSQTMSPLVTLTQAFSGSLSIEALDFAGNSTTITWTATVDVVPPPTPALVLADPGTGKFTHVVNERHADIDIAVTAPADDGPSGQSLTWDFGYTNTTLLAGIPFDEAAFDVPSVTQKLTLLPPVSGNPAVGQLRSVPPLNTYYLAPRIVDEIGNRSPFQTTSIDVSWATSILSPYSDNAQFGSPIAVGGDIDNDTRADFAVGASTASPGGLTNAGSIMVYRAGPTLISQRVDGTRSNGLLGLSIALADITGDSRADLIARESGGLVRIYPALPDGSIQPAFSTTISGAYSLTTIGDVNSDGIRELVLSNFRAPGTTGPGIVYICLGRAVWPATLDVSACEKTIGGTIAGSKLGNAGALQPLGDIDQDGKGDLFVGAPGVNKAYLFLGSKLASGSTFTEADASQQFSPVAGTTFGSNAILSNLDGDAILDIAIADPGTGSIFMYKGTGTSFLFTPTQAAFHQDTGLFGTSMTSGDLTNDAKFDLVVGAGAVVSGYAKAFWSRPELTPSFSSRIGSGVSYFGSTLGIVDANADGKPDLLVGVPNGKGELRIIQ